MSTGNLYAISDIHVDQDDNMNWIKQLSDEKYLNDTLIVAGDVTHVLSKLVFTLKLLKSKFAEVYFCPGNHELWTKNQAEDEALNLDDSIDKFHYILNLCKEIGVRTTPGKHGEHVTIVPLYGWYDETLHMPYPETVSDLELWTDYHMCLWTEEVPRDAAAQYFVHLNEAHLSTLTESNQNSFVVTFSHFFTSKKLMEAYQHEIRSRWQKQDQSRPSNALVANFSLVAGTELLNEQIKRIKPNIHIFGHSHRKMILTLDDGITYINNPLGYVRERNMGLIAPPHELYCIDFHSKTSQLKQSSDQQERTHDEAAKPH